MLPVIKRHKFFVFDMLCIEMNVDVLQKNKKESQMKRNKENTKKSQKLCLLIMK